MPADRPSRVASIDILRGLTIVWVTLFHFHADVRGVPGADAAPSALRHALVRADVAGTLDTIGRALVGLPGYRLDVLLFVTGLVLCLGRPIGAGELLRRRARSILPSYWLGTVVATALLVALSALRAGVRTTPLATEIQRGTLLAGTPYLFDWLDPIRSMSVVARLADQRSMQLVPPSMWYLVLIGQLYVLFPLLRALLRRVGPWGFLAACAAITWGGRWFVFERAAIPGFDPNATVISFLPFRLISPGLGMVAAGAIARLPSPTRKRGSAAALLPALALLLCAAWLGVKSNRANTVMGVIGPALPLLVGLPGLWIVASGTVHAPRLAATLTWVGQRSLSLLVVQDFLRFAVGTVLVLGAPLYNAFWLLAPAYVGAALCLTGPWDALVGRITDRAWPAHSRQQPTAGLAATPVTGSDLAP
jgi:peptidoglycan/LPS O-acetylase OafA/YrhL